MTQPKLTEQDEGTMIPKRDGQGRLYREVRCMNCRALLAEEFVRKGRIRIKCFRCGRISLLEFKPYRSKRPATPGNIKLTKEKST